MFIINGCVTIYSIRNKLEKNVGYATKDHLNGIKENGITQWHRKTFGICKNYDKIKNIV